MIQIDIPMPEHCYDCPCHDGESALCQITGKYYYDEIPRSCPLVELPSAQPEIIYCGECKHMMPDGRCREFADHSIYPSASDFCSAAERKKQMTENERKTIPEHSAWFRIGETLNAESKGHITPEQAIRKIRVYMRMMEKPSVQPEPKRG